MSKNKKFYITTPIYYVNDRPHVGHACTTIAADIVARYHKLFGKKTFLLTGTDEHGTKIEKSAEKANKDPKQLCDENAEIFKKNWQDLNIGFNNFIRTTDDNHKKAVQAVLQNLFDKGFIFKGAYEGLYCSGCEQFKTKTDLIDGKCPDHQIKPELIKEETYIFKLSKFQDVLKGKIESNEFEIQPEERKNEVLGFLKQGLQDISISRKNVKWGIPLPFDETHTTYVWVDAFLNYLTGLGWDGKSQDLSEFWPPDLQLMSKDVLRVHSTIWPALLLALDIPLPKKFFVHGFFTVDGKKMSKSIGNVIAPEDMIERFGTDATRWLLLSCCVFGRDGDVSWQKLTEKYNADLANGIGNSLNRVLTMVEKKFDSVIPEKVSKQPEFLDAVFEKYKDGFEKTRINEPIENILQIIKHIDQTIEELKIYSKTGEEAADDFYVFLEMFRLVAWMSSPFMPQTSDKIFEQLGLNLEEEKQKTYEDAIKWGGLKPGIKIKKAEPLFPRIV